MVVGKTPTYGDDRESRAWVGANAAWFRHLMRQIGIPDTDVHYTYIIKCCPPWKRGVYANNEPPPFAIEACRKYLVGEIEAVDPELIVAVGAPVMKWFGVKGGIHQNAGREFDTEYGLVIPVIDPAGIMKRMNEAPMLVTQLNALVTSLRGPDTVSPWTDSFDVPE